MPFHMKLFIVFFWFLAWAFGSTPFEMPFVQAGDIAVITLDPILVTGSAHPTRLHRSTQSHTIVDHRDFSPLQYNRLFNILQQVPGVHLDERGKRGGINSIYLRGADPNFTLIMLDGIPLNDSTDQRSGSVDLPTIPMNQITRVEIVRGPLSVFYGPEAMASAINLGTDSHANESRVRLLAEGGRFDSRKAVIQGGGTVGPLSANLSYSHFCKEEQVGKDAFAQQAAICNFVLDSNANWDIRLTDEYAESTVRSFPGVSGGHSLALLRETEQRETQTFLTGLTASLGTPSCGSSRSF